MLESMFILEHHFMDIIQNPSVKNPNYFLTVAWWDFSNWNANHCFGGWADCIGLRTLVIFPEKAPLPCFCVFCLRKSLSSSSPRISKASGPTSISVGKTFFLALLYDSDEACDVLKFQVENSNQHLGAPPISGLRWLVWVIYSKSQLPWILRSMEKGLKNLHSKICEPNVTKFKFAGKFSFLGIPT